MTDTAGPSAFTPEAHGCLQVEEKTKLVCKPEGYYGPLTEREVAVCAALYPSTSTSLMCIIPLDACKHIISAVPCHMLGLMHAPTIQGQRMHTSQLRLRDQACHTKR